MKQYLVVHKDHVPESLSGSPRDLNGVYFVYTDYDGSTVADLELPVDADGQPALSLTECVATVAGAMYAHTPIVRLRQPDAIELLSTPHWRIYAGQYQDKDTLEADALVALGVNVDKRKSLDTLVVETQTMLRGALGG